jgi:hypothetical protein
LHVLLDVVNAPGSLASVRDLPGSRAWFGDIVVVLFLCVQFLDGLLTYLGVAFSGVGEGNPLLAHAMGQIGVGPSLAAAKVVAALSAMTLHLLDFHRLLAALTLLYLVLAILPWTFVLVLMH